MSHHLTYNTAILLRFQIERDRKRKDEGKRARADREEVLDKLYSLFEKHQYYSLKDLVTFTLQPVVSKISISSL